MTVIKLLIYSLGISILLGCQVDGKSSLTEPVTSRQITILYTNDEHGWMEGVEEGRSAANLYQLWQTEEGYSDDGAFLLLSGGDNWTGPAISTWVEGKSMVELMNAMSYDASAVGNHEFDFGLESLTTRINDAEFPYLSANTVWKDSGAHAQELGILPFTVKTVAELKIAIIGLTTTSTPTSTMPSVVASLAFTDYETALRKVMPEVNRTDPDMVLVISHVCLNELRPLAAQVADLNIAMIGAGHCNELVAEKVGDTVILGGGYHFTSYAKAVLSYDPVSDIQSAVSFSTHGNSGAPENPEIFEIVGRWRAISASTLAENLGFSADHWSASSPGLQNAIVNSWLEFDPTADVAITNGGGIRAPLGDGEITLGTIVAMLPFSNTIVATRLSGTDLREVLKKANRPVVAGLKKTNGDWVLSKTGSPLQDSEYYRVLVNSFMYDGGDGYASIAEFDPNGFDMAVHYRQPFVQWLKKMDTSRMKPLDLD